jgi:hypothetical protein
MRKIAVVNGKSLLIQGALSYFKNHSTSNVEVLSLDIASPVEALAKLKLFSPDILVVEAQCFSGDSAFCQTSILELFPQLVMLELQVDSPNVRIIRSEQCKPATFEELLSNIKVEDQSLLVQPIQS